MAWDATIKYSGSLWTQPKVTKEVREAMKETASYALTVIQRDTPVKTGLMRKSWKVAAGDRTLKITNTAPYAGFVEYGTSRMTPRQPLGRNVDGIVQQFRNKLSQKILNKIETTGRGRDQQRALARQPARIISPRQTLPRRI